MSAELALLGQLEELVQQVKTVVNSNESTLTLLSTPRSVSVAPDSYTGNVGSSFVVSGENYSTDTVFKFITSGGDEYAAATVTITSSASATITTPRDFTIEEGPLSIKTINPNGSFATLSNAIDTGTRPLWSTTAGSLGELNDETSSFQISATDEENDSMIYSISLGALPDGMILDPNTGAITQDTTEYSSSDTDTTFNFDVQATDTGGNISATRSFSILRNWMDGSTAAKAVASPSELFSLSSSFVNSDGVFWIHDGTPANAYEAYCNMSVESGGWIGLLTIDGDSSNNRHWNDTTFWQSTTLVNNGISNFVTAESKTSAFNTRNAFTEIMLVVHDSTGNLLSYGVWDMLSAYQNQSFQSIMSIGNSNTGTAITEARKTQYGSTGHTSNLDRNNSNDWHCEFTDPVGGYALVVNFQGTTSTSKYTVSNDTTNYVRLTTGLGSSSYGSTVGNEPHSFSGLGGYHHRQGWTDYFDYAAYLTYCGRRDAMTNHPQPNQSGTYCGDVVTYLNRNISIYVR